MKLLFNSAATRRHIEQKDNNVDNEEMESLVTNESKFFYSLPDAKVTFGDKIIECMDKVVEGKQIRAVATFEKLMNQCLQNKMNRIFLVYYKDQYRYICSAIAFVYKGKNYVFTYGRKAVQFEMQINTNFRIKAVYDHMSFADSRIMELYDEDNELMLALKSHIEATFLNCYLTPEVFEKELSRLRNWRPDICLKTSHP